MKNQTRQPAPENPVGWVDPFGGVYPEAFDSAQDRLRDTNAIRRLFTTWIPAPDRVRGRFCAGMTAVVIPFAPTQSPSRTMRFLCVTASYKLRDTHHLDSADRYRFSRCSQVVNPKEGGHSCPPGGLENPPPVTAECRPVAP